MRKDRPRIVGAERCRRCHAGVAYPCRRLWRGSVRTCMVEVQCRRCCAQKGDCRCPVPVVYAGELFPPGHPAWDCAPTVSTDVDRERQPAHGWQGRRWVGP